MIDDKKLNNYQKIIAKNYEKIANQKKEIKRLSNALNMANRTVANKIDEIIEEIQEVAYGISTNNSEIFKLSNILNSKNYNRLAELEELIRKWFVYNKMSNEEKDWFEIVITTIYKNKCLKVYDIRCNQKVCMVAASGTTTKEMFDEAFEFFKIEDNENV